MSRFRFGLAGLGGPLTERELYGSRPPHDRLAAYASLFGCYEMHWTGGRDASQETVEAVLDQAPPDLELMPRFAREVTDRARLAGQERAVEAWLESNEPLLRRPRGPIYMPWHGPRSAESERALNDLLASLWPRLAGTQRIAVEVRDPSWLRAAPIHMLEENGTGLVWSTAAGILPYRLTADFLYIRLTGPRRRTPDEAGALARRVLARPHDERPVYVVSTHHAEPYGLHVMERFSGLVGDPMLARAPRPLRPASHAAQSRLDGYALATA